MSSHLLHATWSSRPEPRAGHRASLRVLLNVFCRPFQEVDDPDLAESSHIVRLADGSAQLHLFGRRPYIEALSRELDHSLNPLEVAFRHQSQSPLTHESAEAYRRGLALISRISLDILTSPDRRAAQKALISIGCRDRCDRRSIDLLLEERSATYALLPDSEVFWTLFHRRSPDGRLDAGHLLYNLIVGMDGFEGARPSAIAAASGIDQP
jgi:hypothetical protein